MFIDIQLWCLKHNFWSFYNYPLVKMSWNCFFLNWKNHTDSWSYQKEIFLKPFWSFNDMHISGLCLWYRYLKNFYTFTSSYINNYTDSYRNILQLCSSIRAPAPSISVTLLALHSRSATADALGLCYRQQVNRVSIVINITMSFI